MPNKRTATSSSLGAVKKTKTAPLLLASSEAGASGSRQERPFLNPSELQEIVGMLRRSESVKAFYATYNRKDVIDILTPGDYPYAIDTKRGQQNYVFDGTQIKTKSHDDNWIGQTRVLHDAKTDRYRAEYAFFPAVRSAAGKWEKDLRAPIAPATLPANPWRKNAFAAYKVAYKARTDQTLSNSENGRLILGIHYPPKQQVYQAVFFGPPTAEVENLLDLEAMFGQDVPAPSAIQQEMGIPVQPAEHSCTTDEDPDDLLHDLMTAFARD